MELLQKYAQKMGLKDDNPSLFEKAEEIRRLWETRGGPGGPNSASLIVVYLDLAAQILGLHGDGRNPKRISSLASFKNPAPYAALLNNVKSQLQLESKDGDLTVEEVCVRLGVPTVRIPALKLLKTYVDSISKKYPLSKMKVGPSHACAAVAVICKSSKINYDKTTLFNLSETPSKVALNKLIFDMTLELKEPSSSSKSHKKDSEGPFNAKIITEEQVRSRKRDKHFISQQPIDEEEDYQKWKAHILKKAKLIEPCK